jgi:hypothetical protein
MAAAGEKPMAVDSKTMAGERHRANVARLRMSDTWKLRCLKIVPG